MKTKNLNNSSKKTRSLIRKVFAEMLCEKKELGKISVSELCKRADISRGSFYSHYDDIYGVAEEYENEMIDVFFNSVKMVEPTNIMQFIDTIFEYIRKNNENYQLLCRSNDFLFAANKLTLITSEKLLEICSNDKLIKNRFYVEYDIKIFLDGLFCEYVRYCRGYSNMTLDNLYDYTKYWVKEFIKKRS